MDTFTQALLGATVGQTFFKSRLGRRAVWWGAVGGALPDLDVLPLPLMEPMAEFLYHRGPTHALWFGPLVGTALGLMVASYYRWKADRAGSTPSDTSSSIEPGSSMAWIGLFIAALFTHPLLDVFTSYGTQLFAPFSLHRFAWHGVAIIDPVYSLILSGALVAGIFMQNRPRWAMLAGAVALVLSTMYLFYGLVINDRARDAAERQLERSGIVQAHVNSYPTLFQIFQRRLVARQGRLIRVGTASFWQSPFEISWATYEEPDSPLVDQLRDTREGRILEWFSLGETAARVMQRDGKTIVEIDDLRYGFPQRPFFGIWGVRGQYDSDGKMIGPVKRFQRPLPAPVGKMLQDLWKGTFGTASADQSP